ncbi:Hypothetical protein NTJ_11922 [Nesidiocoris tenuis]|uniref:Uncharacterized protein n=1 Tax=Nesidiocoris tenuis TaxID=355587 RepID=A0ABN7B7G5_9HEMI|nr:Hypothetical protein NTJ_11922 [Nesidiocoris tenuis]
MRQDRIQGGTGPNRKRSDDLRSANRVPRSLVRRVLPTRIVPTHGNARIQPPADIWTSPRPPSRLLLLSPPTWDTFTNIR